MILLCRIYCLFEEILIVLVSAYLILAHNVAYPFKSVLSSECFLRGCGGTDYPYYL